MRMRVWVAALGLLAIGGGALAQGDVIAERRAGLKRMGQHMEAMKAVADAQGDARSMVPRIDEMITFYRTLPQLFPPGSGTGDTKAQPAIWTDFAAFEAANTRLLGQLDVLKTAAASGDGAAFASAYRATGPQYCGGCHRSFRAR